MAERSQLPRNSFDVDDSLSAARAAPSRVQGGGSGGVLEIVLYSTISGLVLLVLVAYVLSLRGS